MTLKRLLIVLSVLIVLAGGGMLWLARVAYTPQGKARIIIAQLKGDTTSLHGWLLKHHVVKPGFTAPSHTDIYHHESYAAANEMVKLGHEVLPIVIDALQDENRNVRRMAATVCGEYRDPIAIQPLVRCMQETKGGLLNQVTPAESFFYVDAIRYDCMVSLLEIGPEAYGQLMKASEGLGNLRAQIPVCLVQKWGAAAAPKLLELLDDPLWDVRSNAAYELGELKDNRACDSLVRHLADPDETVGRRCAEALNKIGDRKTIPAILKTLHDQRMDTRVRLLAAGALARMGLNDGLDLILAAAKSEDPRDRAYAAEALGTDRVKGTFQPLLLLLSDSESYVRGEAASAIQELHDPRAIPALRKLLNDSDSEVRVSAGDALRNLGVVLPTDTQPVTSPTF